ncbi:hypothetical protein B0H19DRAFT_670543 [Mycena capillaripes]|nr:hypothetical protein B0H19DRAFT_670543 [Mycena capillaripes]
MKTPEALHLRTITDDRPAISLASSQISNSMPADRTPRSSPLPPLNDDGDNVGEVPILSATSTDKEVAAYNRRINTLAARRLRRRKTLQRQMLEDEVAALRVTVADLRTARAAFGLPPVYITKRPPRSANAYMGPRPAAVWIPEADRATATESEMITFKCQQSAQASWRSRRRKMQQVLLLEEEVAELKAEVAVLRVHARL